MSGNSWAAVLEDVGKTGVGHVLHLSSRLDSVLKLSESQSSALSFIKSSAISSPEISVPLRMWFFLTLLWTFSSMASLSTSPQYFVRQDLPIYIPESDISGNGRYHPLGSVFSWIYSRTRPLVLASSDLWISRSIRCVYRCLSWIIRGQFTPILNVFSWIKYLAIIIQASTPDYLFNDFIVLGVVIYGSLQVTETVDSESVFDDLGLDCIHIPIEDWVESMGSGWYRARLYIEMKYGTMTYYVGRRIFHRGHGALITWIYRDISPLPEESQVQNTRPQPVVRPGHSIYKPPHSPCNPATDHRMECIQSQEHLFDEIGPEVTREQKTEAEQEAEQKLKRRTRRGGKKYHERKQRKLERIAGNGDPECGDEEMPED